MLALNNTNQEHLSYSLKPGSNELSIPAEKKNRKLRSEAKVTDMEPERRLTFQHSHSARAFVNPFPVDAF